MKKIANTRQLVSELNALVVAARGRNPSRREIAASLSDLSRRVAVNLDFSSNPGEEVVQAAEKAVQGIAAALGWRIKNSDRYGDFEENYVGEVWGEDTSYFKIRVEVDNKGVVDIDPWVNLNTTSVPNKMASQVFDKLDFKGSADQAIGLLRSAPKLAVDALEAATQSSTAVDALLDELEKVVASVSNSVQSKLEKNGWGFEHGKMLISNSVSPSKLGEKPFVLGTASIMGLTPGDAKEAAKARKLLTDAAKSVSGKNYVMNLPKRSYWSANSLQVPFEVRFV